MTKEEASLLSAYLVVGEDKLKLDTVLKRLNKRLENEGNLDFNSQILEAGRDINTRELLDSLNTPPLASPFRLVIIKDVDKAKKDLVDTLVTYLEAPFASTILVLAASKLTQQSRLYKAVSSIDSRAVIDASERKQSEIPAMVRQLAQSYQITLDYEGAVKVAELVGNSAVALNTEIKKLATYVLALNRNTANVDDVLAVIARSNQPTAWNFVDAFSERKLRESFEILNSLHKESPVNLLYLCVTRLRELIQYKSLVARREGSVAKALGKPDWQVKKLQKLAGNFDAKELRTLLILSARIDARMKSGQDAKLALEELVLMTCR